MSADDQKRAAAHEAAGLVETGMHLGLGTGSTIRHFLDAVSERITAEHLTITCAATSVATERLAAERGIAVAPLTDPLDLAIDGADEIEFGTLHLIKGLGGALLREKQIAQSTHRFIVIAEEGKLVRRLGERTKLPVEIVEFAASRTLVRIGELGLIATIRLDAANEPYRTDNGNLIADCVIPEPTDPATVDASLKTIAGVVETGLFTGLCAAAIIGFGDGSVRKFEGDCFARAGVAANIATLRAMRLVPPGLKPPSHKPIIAVMGVSASGKSTIGALLAATLDVPFIDGDDLHPQSNRDKMHQGIALTDNDRLPWLHRIAGEIMRWRAQGSGGVIVSSLLTRNYRDLVRAGCNDLVLVHLRGDKSMLAARIAARHGHFMPPSLLDSQFATLEPPGADETVITVEVDASPIAIIKGIMRRLAA